MVAVTAAANKSWTISQSCSRFVWRAELSARAVVVCRAPAREHPVRVRVMNTIALIAQIVIASPLTTADFLSANSVSPGVVGG